ncbi:MAG TPA: hypothetical protein VFX67_08415 [Burkholderiales bacterium]|nr:hypothetical protein [Burkholderiales bacterium]
MRPLPRKPRFCQIAALSLAAALFPPGALACAVADDEGTLPLRRAVTRVKHLSETESWQRALPDGVIAQFVLLLDSPRRIRGHCYWPVEVRANGALWKRFLVSTNGKRVLEDHAVRN